MTILIDLDLQEKIKGSNPLVTGPDLDNCIHGCSIDLHIGNIYCPGVESGKPGSADTPQTLPVILKEGETAIIETREEFRLDRKHAAFVFPASSISIQGLLMTNPGHVDPGYAGKLSVTVINMGRESFALVPGGRFLRAFIHELHRAVDKPFKSKTELMLDLNLKEPKKIGIFKKIGKVIANFFEKMNGNISQKEANPPKTVTQELLNKLAPDFLSVNSRAAEAAKKEVSNTTWKIQALQVAIPIVAIAITSYLTSSKYEDRIKKLEAAASIENRMSNVETELRRLKEGAK